MQNIYINSKKKENIYSIHTVLLQTLFKSRIYMSA